MRNVGLAVPASSNTAGTANPTFVRRSLIEACGFPLASPLTQVLNEADLRLCEGQRRVHPIEGFSCSLRQDICPVGDDGGSG
jgi:hypothetical protein